MITYIVDKTPMMQMAMTMLVHRVKPGSEVICVSNIEELLKKDDAPGAIIIGIENDHETAIIQIDDVMKAFATDKILVVLHKDLPLDSMFSKKVSATCLSSRSKTQVLMNEISDLLEGNPNPIKLTFKQRCILIQINYGKTLKQIAETYGTEINTIRTHCHLMYKKIGAKNSLAAINYGRRNGWI